MAFGLIDTSYIDFPSNIDETYLRGLQTRSGLSFADLAGRLDAAIGGVNAGIDTLSAALLSPRTTEASAQGGTSGSMTPRKKSQYTVARPQLVEAVAHMLAIDELDIALGFTEDGLMEISTDSFQRQVDKLRAGLQLAYRRDVLIRLFSDAEVPIDSAAAATSPGFAGSGTGGNIFAGTYPDGTALPGGYTHYYRDTAANRAVVVKAARDRLKKWYPQPYDLIGSQAAIDALAALPDFVQAGSPLVRPAQGSAEALVDAAEFVGVYDKDIRVWHAITDFTDDHYAIWKSFGNVAANNPLVMRYDALRGPDAYVRSRELFPLAQANAMWKYGINVNNRVGATLIKIAASGAYTPPTIIYG